jgi:hypothetical protein
LTADGHHTAAGVLWSTRLTYFLLKMLFEGSPHEAVIGPCSYSAPTSLPLGPRLAPIFRIASFEVFPVFEKPFVFKGFYLVGAAGFEPTTP